MICAVLPLAGGAASPPSSRVWVKDFAVRLYLENSGHWSDDVSSIENFYAINFVPFGPGFDASDNFHSFMIELHLAANGEAFEANTIATVRLLSVESGKAVLTKTIKGEYVGPSGHAYVPIFVEPGRECQPLKVEVKSSKSTITKDLSFSCYE